MLITEAYEVFQTNYLLNENKSEKTIKEYRSRLLGLNSLTWLTGDVPIELLGIDHVVAWKLYMREEGMQPRYINARLSSLRWFLKWCGENEMRVMPWQSIKFEQEDKYKPRTILTPEEIEKLIAAVDTLRDKAIITLFFGSGMRSEELISMTRGQWDSAKLVNAVEVMHDSAEPVWEFWTRGKGKKWRPICVYQSVKSVVDSYLLTREDQFDPLFISLQNRQISYSTVGKMLHKAVAKAGLQKHVTQHILRHSYATDRSASGMPTSVLSYNLGHANESTTTKIYVNIKQFHVRQSLNTLSMKPRGPALVDKKGQSPLSV